MFASSETRQRIGIAGLALFIVGGVVMLVAIAASFVGLGKNESFVLYIALGWTRTDMMLVGLAIFFLGLFFTRYLSIDKSFRWKHRSLQLFHGLVQTLLLSSVCIAAIVLGLKLTDLTLTSDIKNLPGHDLGQQNRTARTLELYPFTGWHMQANFQRGDINLGSKGFAVDFDFQAPPPKNDNEYRIILIGGSGAQGWGASSTEKTMARLLERKLNAQSNGRKYRVINLAMGSSVTYQNFISLNRWAHSLSPDLILSYSGINDYVVPVYHEDNLDVFYQFNRLNTLAIAARGSEYPPQLKWLIQFLPNLMTQTSIGYGIKIAFYQDYFEQRAKQSYRTNSGLQKMPADRFLQETITPFYIHALKSIKRDFDGIPMVLILQASSPEEQKIHLTTGLSPNFYEKMYQQVATELSAPGWHLANFHAFNMRAPSPHIAVHPNDEGQKVLTDFIYRELLNSFLAGDIK